MFDRDRLAADGRAAAKRTGAAKAPTAGSPASASSNVGNTSRMSNFAGPSVGLSRTLSTPPVAESTQIGSITSVWNGASPGGQTKRRPTSPLWNNRSLFKSSGNLSGIGRVNPQVYTDARSPGLVNRLVSYYDREQSAMNRSQSLSSVYSKPGQFPVVHLRKHELRYGANSTARRKGNFSTIRIAPPEKSLFQPSKRSSIFRTGSLFHSGSANETTQESIFGGRGVATSSGARSGGGDESDAENRVITPCAELEATPTRSVLDALKEISRKRINSEELDADRIKKQCKELSELDAAGSGPPSSTGAVAIGTLGLAAKRSREQASGSSPSSPSEGGSGLSRERAGSTAISGGDQQALKKRFCTKNNDILSSLSSSTIVVSTPKRLTLPRPDRRFNISQSPWIPMFPSMMCSMPSSSSTMMGPTTPDMFSNMGLESPGSARSESAYSGSKAEGLAPAGAGSSLNRWSQLPGTDQCQPEHRQPARAQPKITLFNRPYDATAKSTATVTSDGEEEEHGEGGGKVQFVKPKEKSPQMGSARDPLKKPAASKLSVMLKCLSGDLDDDYAEEDVENLPTLAPAHPPTQTRLGFTINPQPVNDTVDAPPKEATSIAPPKQTPTVTAKVVETPASNGATTPPAPAAVTNNGISALIFNPIKDAGLGKGSLTDAPNKERAPSDNATKLPEVAVVESEGQKESGVPTSKPLTFAFGASQTTATNTTGTGGVTSPTVGFTSPAASTAPVTTVSSGALAPTAAFTFGTPAASADAPKSTLASPSLISFSPAPAAGMGGFGTTFGSVNAAKPSSVLQFGNVASTTTSSTTQSATPASTFTFAGAAASSPASSTTTSATAAGVTSPTFSFGGGSTFSAFKSPTATLPLATTPSTTPASAVTTTTNPANSGMFNMPAPVAVATTGTSGSPASTFSFGAKPLTTASVGTPPVTQFGSSLRSIVSSASTPSSTTGATAATFTFGGAATHPTPTAATATATAPSGSFSFGGTVNPSPVPTTATPTSASSTFPTFGSMGGATNVTSPAAAALSPTAAQPFMFGGPKPPAGPGAASTGTTGGTTTNLFAAAAASASPANSSATTNMFGAASAGSNSSAAPAASGNLFGAASANTNIFGSATATIANQAVGQTPAAAAAAASPTATFTFGAKANAAGANGAQNGALNPPAPAGASFFGGAGSITSPGGRPQPTQPTPASGGGMFTFGSANSAGLAATGGSTAQVPAFGAPSTATAGPAANTAAPFSFGAVTAKPPPATTASGGPIFGMMANNNNNSTNSNAVPTFGSGMNGGNPLQGATQAPTSSTFGGGPIFGSTANTGNPASGGGAPSGGLIFGSNTQTNGPQNASNATGQAPSSGGGLFTFGASPAGGNASSAASTFGSNTGVTGGNTFGNLANNSRGTAGGLTNGIGGGTVNKPFTFGASSAPTPVQQQQQQAPAPAPVSGGFNFNIGSNAPNAAPKPFSFAGANASSGGNNGAAPPTMFGAPATNQPAAPFTFGASVANNNNNAAGNMSSPAAPFTFGASVAQTQQQQGTAAPGAGSPFNFSAANVATVAPQQHQQQHQQQQQQQQPAFNFGAAAPSPFGAPGGGAPAPAFGSAPTFGAPVAGVGGMPTFSIGTSSTPNGQSAGPRRIKIATRRVK